MSYFVLKRALVVSVGGSKGAYAGGIIDYYYSIGVKYDIMIGCSTGALIVPFAASGNMKNLREGYTSITHKDIFTVSPFKIKEGKDGIYKYTLNNLNIFYNTVIRRKVSFGDSTVLREKTIPRFFTRGDYNKIILDGKELEIGVSNLTLGLPEFKRIDEYSYEQFCDWIWASTCAPPYMSVPKIGDYQYVDGALVSVVPLSQAIIKGADEIDVIILHKEYPEVANIELVRNPIQLITKCEDLTYNTIKKSNLNLGMLSDMAQKDVRINFHYTERRLTNNSLIFSKEQMSKWWDEGFEYAKDNKCKSYMLHGETNTYRLIQED